MLSAKKFKRLLIIVGVAVLLVSLNYPITAHAMHIMEGMLPPGWCIFWFAIATPFLHLWSIPDAADRT
jgi:cobalt/nickel transport system permease protein